MGLLQNEMPPVFILWNQMLAKELVFLFSLPLRAIAVSPHGSASADYAVSQCKLLASYKE